MSPDTYAKLMRDAVVQLPQDLKTTLRVVEDENIDESCRAAIAGALLHVISGDTSIPGVRGSLQHLGAAILLRMSLDHARDSSPERYSVHAAASPEFLQRIPAQLAASREFFGEGTRWFEELLEGFGSANHQGRTAQECIHDEESGTWLYDTVHVSLVERLEIDEEDVDRDLRGLERARQSLVARAK